jgi:uncharacterized protein (UPF0332 family)
MSLPKVAILNPEHLFEQADGLVASAAPRQADLKRAISSAYYGLFHAIMTRAADQVVGIGKRSTDLYELVYRSVDHARLKAVCNQIASESSKIAPYMPSRRFGAEIKDVARAIVDMQEKRHTADYNPLFHATKSGVKISLREARAALQTFHAAPEADVEALSLLLFFKPRE